MHDRGSLWYLKADVAAHIGGGKERRPYVIVGVEKVFNNASHVIVAELTKYNKKEPKTPPLNVFVQHSPANGLGRDSFVSCEALHNVAKESLIDFIGMLSPEIMVQVTEGIRFALIPGAVRYPR